MSRLSSNPREELAQATSSEINKIKNKWDKDLLYQSSEPFKDSYISVGCFQRSRVALNPFPTSLLDFFPCGGEITPSQTSRGTLQSLGARRATPCRLGEWIPKSNKCHEDFSLWTRMLKNGFAHFHSIFLPNLSLNPNSLLFSNLLQI